MRTILMLAMVLCAVPAFAQQTGTISGKVVGTDGGPLPGVTVEARSTVLPGPRSAVTTANGGFNLPALPPGDYTVTFTLQGMQTVTRTTGVFLGQDATLDIKMSVQAVAESVTVTAEKTFVDKGSAAITSTIPSNLLMTLPSGTEYRDIIRLLPAVQLTPDSVRGPSAGASGQDNVYNFDGVNVTTPLFGTLSAEPASHDIAQVTVMKGGAKALDFNRAGGFSIDSISKSGTSKYTGEASVRMQRESMAAKLTNQSLSQYNQNRTYVDANVGGPVVKDKLFFFGSYYLPYRTRDNRSNAYGELPDYSSTRHEGFGKVTLSAAKNLLINASYRHSETKNKSDLFGSTTNVTAGSGNKASQTIITGDGSWIINNRSFLTFKMTRFSNPNDGTPDNLSSAVASTAVGTMLDINNLDKLGALTVPLLNSTAAVNAFRAPYTAKYGYTCTAAIAQLTGACTAATVGQVVGGGTNGYYSQFDNDDFFRTAGQIGYNLSLDLGQTRHDLHVGYQKYVDAEDLTRNSNGWGTIQVIGGSTSFSGTPIFFQTAFQQQTTGVIPKIHSEYRSESFELNDSMSYKRLALNVGAIVSHDTLYGQGLNEAAGTPSGFIKASGNLTELRKYKMYEIPWKKMVQPRLSATYSYDDTNTVYASYARYNPAASSLPRAASWDRNLAVTINGYFDANGRLFGTDTNASSTGKLFVPNMTPRTIDEYLIGTSRNFGSGVSARVYWRYRKNTHFWEDTNNNARRNNNPGTTNPGFRTANTPSSVPDAYYIEDLGTQLAALGGNQNSYVIADLDGSFTKYYETTAELSWTGRKGTIGGSYTWSHYFGNFDQDGSAGLLAGGGTFNDMNTFIGSSNIGDGGGRQLWDLKEGDLHGDRPHVFKAYGSYRLPWQSTIGFFAVAQSGSAWEAWDRTVYSSVIGTSTSETIRYAEQAGSRRTPKHYQLDLNYTQDLNIGRHRLQIAAELFNVGNTQTEYNPNPVRTSATFGQYFSFYSPRRLEVTARYRF